jgi:purine-binding chemotaxis protein CheW
VKFSSLSSRVVAEERATPARLLAVDQSATPTVPALVFRVGGERYAVRLDEVAGVANAGELRPLPQPPPFVVGILDRDEQPVPVYDLAGILSLDSGPCRHVVLHDRPGGPIGFLVEQAAEVAHASERDLPPSLRRAGGAVSGIADIGGQPAFLIDLKAAAAASVNAPAPSGSAGERRRAGKVLAVRRSSGQP